jgi:hypothetical protein
VPAHHFSRANVFVSYLTKCAASGAPAGYNMQPMPDPHIRIEVAGQHVASGRRLHILPDNPIRMPLDPSDLDSRAYLSAWAVSKEERDVTLVDLLGKKRAIRAKVAIHDDACFFYFSSTPVIREPVSGPRNGHRSRH